MSRHSKLIPIANNAPAPIASPSPQSSQKKKSRNRNRKKKKKGNNSDVVGKHDNDDGDDQSQTVKRSSSVLRIQSDEALKNRINMSVLQKKDPHIVNIEHCFDHVVLYKFDAEHEEWVT